MRCGGCGAKGGASVLSRVMKRLRDGGHIPPTNPEHVLIGLDAPDDCALLAPTDLASVHTVDFFRSMIDDPYVFGQVAANHSLSDCHAMGAPATGALAVAVVPYGLEPKVRQFVTPAERRAPSQFPHPRGAAHDLVRRPPSSYGRSRRRSSK